ncbi:DNA replication and repair protein RecO [Natranaerovirga hydrolytica]|uniref:DNA repair protein RecO n=1 Tax=Natranaerovirga hydrolytica TaxID=680378 RepID=A0A4R1MZY4_9FIRM|nr:DNA repair protein RecO [Natranaerovirga hydrolytica]TCK98765.1 DNA replication and repair protein RecO [Natranaerovirga hydrolytica]
MSQLLKVTGLILNTMPIGENDKRLVMLTKEKGKINAFAKGSRKSNSSLLGISQTFTIGEFLLYKGKSSYSVSQGNIIESFYNLRNDIEKLSYGLYFNEFVDYITDEEMETYDIMVILYKSLLELTKDVLSHELIKCIFELKLLSISGLTPQVINCVGHGCDHSINNQIYFSPSQGGLLCKAHSQLVKDAIPIDESTRYTMQYILSANTNKLYTFKTSDTITKNLSKVLDRYIAYHIDYSFKTLKFINNLDNPY